MKKYEDHPISQIFPMMEDSEKRKLGDDIKQNGLQETIILLPDDDDKGKLKVLDGRNRQEGCILVGVEPRFANWADLSAEVRAAGPTAFVMGRNLHRRHLTPSQRAAVAAESLPFFQKEADERKKSTLRQNASSAPNGANGDEHDQSTGHAAEDESQVPKRGPKKKAGAGKASAAAGKSLGVSARSVERAAALKKKDPKKFAAVKAGAESLGKASRDPAKEAAKAAAQKKASAGLTGNNFINDLFAKAKSAGGKLVATFEDGWKIVVTRKAPKAEKPAKAPAKKAAKKAPKQKASRKK